MFNNNYIFGALLIILGINILLKAFFNISLPLFRIIGGIIVLIFGFKLLFGNFHTESSAFIKGNQYQYNRNTSVYKTSFGDSYIDLNDIDLKDKNDCLSVKVSFGSTTIRIPKNLPAIINLNIKLGDVKTPEGMIFNSGKNFFTTQTYKANEPHLILNIDVLLGEVNITN